MRERPAPSLAVDTLDLLRLILARDVAALPAMERWDAAAWETVHRAIAAWDAAPLAYAAARAGGFGRHVPAPLLAQWRQDHTQTTAVNLRLAFEAEGLVAGLAPLGARASPLKGTALFLLGVYRDPGARPTCDVDLLIRPEDGPIVHRAMLARGFAQMRVGGPKHWPPYVREGLVVEVHEHAFWSLSDGHRVGLPEVLGRDLRPTLGATVAHLLHHLFESSVTTPWLVVKTLADLAEVRAVAQARSEAQAEQQSVATNEIAEAARRFGLSRRLGALAGLLERVIGRPVPAEWTVESTAGEVDALQRRCVPQTRLFEQALRLPDRAGAFARMPLAEKTALLRYHLVPPAEALRALYGLSPGSKWVWPLYPLRPAHLVARSALDAARLFVRKKAGS
jgi:hypothetical protein